MDVSPWELDVYHLAPRSACECGIPTRYHNTKSLFDVLGISLLESNVGSRLVAWSKSGSSSFHLLVTCPPKANTGYSQGMTGKGFRCWPKVGRNGRVSGLLSSPFLFSLVSLVRSTQGL